MALLLTAVRADRFCDGVILNFSENGSIEKWLLRLKEIDEKGEVKENVSKIELIKGSCVDQTVDIVVNAANSGLWAGGGICGVIFKKAGMTELTKVCNKYNIIIIENTNGLYPYSEIDADNRVTESKPFFIRKSTGVFVAKKNFEG